MIHPRLATSISVFLVLVAAPTLAGAQTLSRQLVELAPTIRSHDPMIQSFAVDGSLAGRLGFRVTHEKPNRFSLILSDGTDGTPLLMAAEGQSILYDVVNGRLLRFRHFAAGLWIFHDAGKGKHGFSFEWDARSHPQDLKVLETIVDLRGMIRAGKERLVVHRKGETVFTLESGPPTSPDRGLGSQGAWSPTIPPETPASSR